MSIKQRKTFDLIPFFTYHQYLQQLWSQIFNKTFVFIHKFLFNMMVFSEFRYSAIYEEAVKDFYML